MWRWRVTNRIEDVTLVITVVSASDARMHRALKTREMLGIVVFVVFERKSSSSYLDLSSVFSNILFCFMLHFEASPLSVISFSANDELWIIELSLCLCLA